MAAQTPEHLNSLATGQSAGLRLLRVTHQCHQSLFGLLAREVDQMGGCHVGIALRFQRINGLQ